MRRDGVLAHLATQDGGNASNSKRPLHRNAPRFRRKVVSVIQGAPQSLRTFLVVACVGLALAFSGSALRAQQAAASPSKAAPATPTADQILNRYLEAEGGRAAWQKVTSRVSTGKVDVRSMNISGTVEIYEKAPDYVLGAVTIAGASFRQGFDGTVGWTDDPQNGLREQEGAELAETRRESDFYHTLNLRKVYTKFTVIGREKIGERDAYFVEAVLPDGGEPDKMYFDTQTGLALRVISRRHGPEGETEFRQDFEDFRDVDGIKLPFVIHQTDGDTAYTITISEVHHNVSIEDSQFAKPAVQ
jgi:zinc protease